MSLIYRFTPLDDAYALLVEAKGLPNVATATRRLQRCVRACILLSWIALEEGLDHAVELWNRKGRNLGPLPGPLKRRLSTVLAAVSRPPIDDVEFTTLRKIRNDLTHPRATVDEPELAVENAERTFEFCVATIRALFPFPVDCQF
jgi:hypothetical protein